MKKQGSILFIIMGVLIISAFIMYASLRNVLYLTTLVYEREKSEVHYYYAYSFQQFVLYRYQDMISKSSLAHNDIFVGDWPDKSSGYSAYAWVEVKKKAKTLHVELKKDKRVVATLHS